MEEIEEDECDKLSLSVTVTQRRTPSSTKNGSLSARSSQKSVETKHSSSFAPSSRVEKSRVMQWCDFYAPQSEKELCIHSSKIKQVKAWLLQAFQLGGQNCLVIRGPSGSGKTTTVKVLCKELGVGIVQWAEPTNVQSETRVDDEIRLPYESKMDAFFEFLARSNKYASLLSSEASQRIVLVEEFPFTGNTEQKARFNQQLAGLLRTCRRPLVFVLTEAADATRDQEHTIFDRTFFEHPSVSEIGFNPVSATGIKKVLKQIVAAEKLKLDDSTVENIVVQAHGDVRHAIYSMQMLCLPLAESQAQQPSGSDSQSRDRKRKLAKVSVDSAAPLMEARDESLTLFRAIGRILHAKKELTPEEITAKCAVPALTFCDYLHHNFTNMLNQPEDFDRIEQTLSCLSDADILGHWAYLKYGDSTLELHPEDMAVSLACRGYLATNPSLGADRFSQIRAPQSDRVRRIASQRMHGLDAAFQSPECKAQVASGCFDSQSLFTQKGLDLSTSRTGRALDLIPMMKYCWPHLDLIATSVPAVHYAADLLSRVCNFSDRNSVASIAEDPRPTFIEPVLSSAVLSNSNSMLPRSSMEAIEE